MRNSQNSQLELFPDARTRKAPGAGRGSFFTAMRGYEKKIISVIFFFITAIVAFSLGVEKGRNSAQRQQVSRITQEKPLTAPLPRQDKQVQKQELTVESPPALIEPLTKYTIQIASYKNAKYAQQESEALKKKGFNARVASRGEYFVLYVGNFSSKQEADSFLSQIKKEKRYAGAILRRL